MNTLWRLLALLLGGYGALCLLVVLFQRRLMYFPSRATEVEALGTARGLGLEPWKDGSGQLAGWRAPCPGAPVRVLVFHGNAGSALDRAYYLPLFPRAEVILFEYPGYGPRAGEPGQERVVEAALQALEQSKREFSGPTWLLGESLGSGVACAVVARRPRDVAGLLLVTPFARMTDVAAWHYPWLPVRFLLRDRWDNVEALTRYTGPVALVIAGRDEVVGAAQGRLLAASAGPRARAWEQERAGHNSLDLRPDAAPWPELRAWMASAAPGL